MEKTKQNDWRFKKKKTTFPFSTSNERERNFKSTTTTTTTRLDTSIQDLLLLDVCPLGLGIGDIHGCMHTLIRRNTTIPTRTQFYSLFTNAYAYQTTATIPIFEGEHYLTKYNVCFVLDLRTSIIYKFLLL